MRCAESAPASDTLVAFFNCAIKREEGSAPSQSHSRLGRCVPRRLERFKCHVRSHKRIAVMFRVLPLRNRPHGSIIHYEL